MSKNTAIGIILLVLLFVWSIQNSNKQQELAQAELQRKAAELAAEKAKQDSLAAIKGEKTDLGVPEITASPSATPPANPVTKEESPFAAQDIAEATAEIAAVPSQKEILVETDKFFV